MERQMRHGESGTTLRDIGTSKQLDASLRLANSWLGKELRSGDSHRYVNAH